jgi:hypothetical protein
LISISLILNLRQEQKFIDQIVRDISIRNLKRAWNDRMTMVNQHDQVKRLETIILSLLPSEGKDKK